MSHRIARGSGLLLTTATLIAASCQPTEKVEVGQTISPLPACPADTTAGTITRNISYGGDPYQILDLYLPSNAGQATLPVMVWIHGGGWLNGDHAGVPRQIRDLTLKGMAVISIDYRRSTTPYPTTIYDVRQAIRWIYVNATTYGFDPNHIGVSGASAGGHLAAMLGTAADVSSLDLTPNGLEPRVHLVVDFYGPSELLEMDNDWAAASCTTGSNQHSVAPSPETDLIDCTTNLSNCTAEAIEASPVTWASSDDPPFIVLHGADDCTVPTPQGQRMYDAMVAAGVPATHIVTPNAGHLVGEVGTPEAWDTIYAAVDTYLRGCEVSTLDSCLVDQCATQAAACEADPICLEVEECIRGCYGQSGCVNSCISGQPRASVDLHRALYQCGNPRGCYTAPSALDPCFTQNCPTEATACEADAACLRIEECMQGCFGQNGCVSSCTAGEDPASVSTHRAMFQCGRGFSCY